MVFIKIMCLCKQYNIIYTFTVTTATEAIEPYLKQQYIENLVPVIPVSSVFGCLTLLLKNG